MTAPAPSQPEYEDDPAELVECLIWAWIDSGISEGQKQQFRDALAKFVDERIAAALRRDRIE